MNKFFLISDIKDKKIYLKSVSKSETKILFYIPMCAPDYLPIYGIDFNFLIYKHNGEFMPHWYPFVIVHRDYRRVYLRVKDTTKFISDEGLWGLLTREDSRYFVDKMDYKEEQLLKRIYLFEFIE